MNTIETQNPTDATSTTSDVTTRELKDLLVKSIKWSEAVYNQNTKILRHMRWASVMGTLRLIIILIPIILGIIYLPELLSGMWDQYQSALGISGHIPDNETLRVLIDQFEAQRGQ
jgi:hypothetical protein